jgi:hypothetical protein
MTRTMLSPAVLEEKAALSFFALLLVLAALLWAGAAQAFTVTNISKNTSGNLADGDSVAPMLSRDASASFAVYSSAATDLVLNDTNYVEDIFFYTRETPSTDRVNLSSYGNQAYGGASNYPSVSASANKVAFQTSAMNFVYSYYSQIYVRDVSGGTTILISADYTYPTSAGNAASMVPTISENGRFVSFASLASNLVSDISPGSMSQIFRRDIDSSVTELISVANGGGMGDSSCDYVTDMSADGRFVVFASSSTNLLASATNGQQQIFLRDTVSGVTELISQSSAGVEGDGGSKNPRVSEDGNYVVFESYASNLVSGDTNAMKDIFLRNRASGVTTRVSVDSAGNQADGASYSPAMTKDAYFIAYASDATNLVSGDTNGVRDIFVHHKITGETRRVSLSSDGSQFASGSETPSISGNGVYVAYSVHDTGMATAPPLNRDAAGTTLSNILLYTAGTPTLSTTTPSSIGSNTAVGGGTITDDGGVTIIETGLCWGTTPSLAGGACATGPLTSPFSVTMTGLTPSTTYYVKAYATNSAGRAYGDERSFTTSSGVAPPSVTTTGVQSQALGEAVVGGKVTSDGGASVSERGVCWNSTGSPTTSDSCASAGAGTGAFTSTLGGLTAGATYYARAYAINSAGTAYGGEISFLSPKATDLADVGALSVTSIISTGATVAAVVRTEGASSVTSRGVCWSTTTNPTTADSYIQNGQGLGHFSVAITGLQPQVTYYARPYAVNAQGTAYGNILSFTTLQSGAQGSAVVVWHNRNNRRSVMQYIGSGTPVSSAWLGTPAPNWSLVGVGDVNGDGYPDVYWRNVASGENVVQFYRRDTSIGWKALPTVPTDVWRMGGMGDFNKDGHADAMWQSSEGPVFFERLDANGHKGWSYYGSFKDENWKIVSVADLNNDGYADLVFRNFSTGQNGVDLLANMKHSGFVMFQPVENRNWTIVGAADFNGDGKTDLVWKRPDSGKICIEYMSGVSHLSYQCYESNTPPAWQVSGAGTLP